MLNQCDYDVVKILRVHSKNNDSADVQTQVWSCAFEPENSKSFSPGAITVATCGGNCVCFCDCITGRVLAKFYPLDQRILFFSLAWSSLPDGKGCSSILASGGSLSYLFIIDSQSKSSVVEHQFGGKGKLRSVINTLCFHPTEQHILFCGSSDGFVRVVEVKKDISNTGVQNYSVNLLHTFETNFEVYDLTFCLTTRYLLSSCDSGLNCFMFPSKNSLTDYKSSKEKPWVKVNLISRSKDIRVAQLRSGNLLVDAVQVLKDGLVACKYALHGCIYIFDLNKVRDAQSAFKDMDSFEIEPLYSLGWSNTDNYFMYMGVSIECEVLSCGDDNGNIWLYDLGPILTRSAQNSTLDPSFIIQWPNLKDHYNDKKRKLRLDTYDIVVDRVAVHSSGRYIVAVTNNNLVCLWQKIS